jgi:hypothetical protein
MPSYTKEDVTNALNALVNGEYKSIRKAAIAFQIPSSASLSLSLPHSFFLFIVSLISSAYEWDPKKEERTNSNKTSPNLDNRVHYFIS